MPQRSQSSGRARAQSRPSQGSRWRREPSACTMSALPDGYSTENPKSERVTTRAPVSGSTTSATGAASSGSGGKRCSGGGAAGAASASPAAESPPASPSTASAAGGGAASAAAGAPSPPSPPSEGASGSGGSNNCGSRCWARAPSGAVCTQPFAPAGRSATAPSGASTRTSPLLRYTATCPSALTARNSSSAGASAAAAAPTITAAMAGFSRCAARSSSCPLALSCTVTPPAEVYCSVAGSPAAPGDAACSADPSGKVATRALPASPRKPHTLPPSFRLVPSAPPAPSSTPPSGK